MENGAPSQRKNILERNKTLIRNILDAVLIFTIVSLILVITFYEIQKHEYKEITTKVGNKNITPTSHVHVHEQVHLSLGVEPNSMTIAWLTLTNLEDDSLTPTVKYSSNESNLNISIKGITKSFFDMSKSIKRFVHKVELKNLKPNTRYFYQVGDTKTWSKIFNFKNLDINSNAKVCFFGDMDATYNG
uniref:Pur_ac_phosph_N domain-containing protein n=1 Tax=Parastrongyloides trichosuri TaxID=131310 RepID=A0A0N4ZTX4_PARTI